MQKNKNVALSARSDLIQRSQAIFETKAGRKIE